jgi:hypothetical protein
MPFAIAARVLCWLVLVWPVALGAGANTSVLDLQLSDDAPAVVVLTTTNTQAKPAFLLRPDRPWHWYGWSLTIDGPEGSYGFYPPPPSPWVPGTESFVLLMPGESLRTRIDLSEARRIGAPDAWLPKVGGTYRVSISYTFDANREIAQSPSSIIATVYA